MGELIEVSTLTDLAPGTCQQVDAQGQAARAAERADVQGRR